MNNHLEQQARRAAKRAGFIAKKLAGALIPSITSAASKS